MGKYIVEKRNGNPAIHVQNPDGSYEVLTHGAGEKTFEDVMELVRLANLAYAKE